MSTQRKTCFVVMGFGEKVDFETGRKLNLDATYKHLIKPAVTDAGLECVRADEIAHSGVIDVPMYKQLLLSDLVVADVSTANSNAFYELGVRHALRPHTTVVIAEDKFKFPFDINRNKILKYKHLGEDIGASEVERFKARLKEQITAILEKDPPEDDSPVYTFLQRLRRFKLPEDLEAHGAGPSAAAVEFAAADPPPADQTHSALMEQVAEAKKRDDFVTAKALLSTVRAMMKGKTPNKPEDPYIIQQLALATYKSKLPDAERALKDAHELLQMLDPKVTNDPETLGLWGAVHKRLWEVTGEAERKYLDEAILAYERGFYLRDDHYNGINLAYLLNVRAAKRDDPAEAVADFVLARRARREVVRICKREAAALPEAAGDKDGAVTNKRDEKRYWILASLAEAYAGLGTEAEAEAEQRLEDAYEVAPASWMKDSTREQIAKLKVLLADSPLKHVRADAG